MRRYLPRTQKYAQNFPTWSASANDAFSNAQCFINSVLHEVRDLKKTVSTFREDIHLRDIDADRHPYRSWIVTKDDVGTYTGVNKPDYVSSISTATGAISGTNISILEVDSLDGVLKALPTAYRVSETYTSGSDLFLDGVLSGYDLGVCECNFNGNIETLLVSGTQEHPNLHLMGSLPMSKLGKAGDETLSFATRVDPSYNMVETYINIPTGQQVLLPWKVEEHNVKIYDSQDKAISGAYTIIKTNDYSTENYSSIVDVDKNGIIDWHEVSGTYQRLGENSTLYESSEWNENYAMYDFNQDGKIDNADLQTVLNSRNSISRPADIVDFVNGGSYRLISLATEKGETSAFYRELNKIKRIENGSVSRTYDTTFGEEFIDVTYEEEFDTWYCLSNTEKCIYAVKFDKLQGIADKVKMVLPFESLDMNLHGITIDENHMYVLVSYNNNTIIYHMDLKSSNPDQTITKLPIHSGDTISGETEIFIRDNIGITDARGIGSVGEHKLVITEGNSIKIIQPLFDYFVREDGGTDDATVQFLENYESFNVSPSGTIDPVYFNIWNIFDEWAFLCGLGRLPGESNNELRDRSLSVWKNFPGKTEQGNINNIATALGQTIPHIVKDKLHLLPNVITPDCVSGTLFKYNGQEVPYDTVQIGPIAKSNDIIGYNYKFMNEAVTIAEIDINAVIPYADNASHLATLRERIITYKKLTQTDIDNKYATLLMSPASPVDISVVGGMEFVEGVDFLVNDNIISWNGLSAETILDKDDTLLIGYWKVL